MFSTYRKDALGRNHFRQHDCYYVIVFVFCGLSLIGPGLSKNYALWNPSLTCKLCNGSSQASHPATIRSQVKGLIPFISLMFHSYEEYDFYSFTRKMSNDFYKENCTSSGTYPFLRTSCHQLNRTH